MELHLTIPGATPDLTPPNASRCEACGAPITLGDLVAIVRLFAGLAAPPELREEWLEYRTVPGEVALQMRPHYPQRCRLVRAGSPEPWDDDDWDDDE